MRQAARRYDEVLGKLAKSYEAKGYSVQIEADLGGGEKGLKADLLATQGNETVLVQMKLTTSSASDHALRQYAELAHAKGWRFVIAVADSNVSPSRRGAIA